MELEQRRYFLSQQLRVFHGDIWRALGLGHYPYRVKKEPQSQPTVMKINFLLFTTINLNM